VSVFVQAFAHVAERLRLPRVLVTPHLMGRTMGPVGDLQRQRQVTEAALRTLVDAPGPETRSHFQGDC
jgi:hypothetical protein